MSIGPSNKGLKNVVPVTLKQMLWHLVVECINVEALVASFFYFPATVLPKGLPVLVAEGAKMSSCWNQTIMLQLVGKP
jgi:hypothetical protein